ncbi:MAG: protein kinase domain-containing protein [Gemmatimonadales bacterium]
MSGPLERLRAGLAERYDVERQIGEGGMAIVFRAVDKKHGRPVALKVLRPELAATMGTERFVREIELSAKLQHPHIVPLFDSGAVDGMVYYVMPFVEGESLRDRLLRDKALPYDQALPLIREVASALAYAHDHGIIHRDIKPENIMLSGGHAMVADFGIARAVSAAQEGHALTGMGFAVGTPAYMSPEQATASEVDARSDQYSLGCVLYEAVTGGPPFAGPTVQAVLKQSLTGARPKLSKVSRTAPASADPVVAKALASDPAKRFPSVAAFSAALVETATPASKIQKQIRILLFLVGFFAAAWVTQLTSRYLRNRPVSAGAGTAVAVLPFTASGAAIEVLGEGMVDLLSTNLNAVGGGLRAVEPRQVMARWRKGAGAGDVAAAMALAGDLGADAVVLGSLVGTGGRVRISATVHGRGGSELARAQVEGAQDSVLGLVDQLSGDLIRGLWRSKEPVPSLRVSGLVTGSFEAMGAYLDGERHYRRSQWDSAEAAFARAVEKDSTFSLAHYRLGASIGWQGGYGSPRARRASEAARRFAIRLPARERSIVTAYDLFNRGNVAAADSMRGYVATYPDDVDGWFLLGESLYHNQSINGLDPASIRVPFDRVLALDSTLSPAAIHPAELSLVDRDSILLQRYVALLRRGGSATQAAAFDAGSSLVWKGQLDSATATRIVRWPGAFRAALTGAIRSPAITGDSLIRLLSVVTATVPVPGASGAPSAEMMFARAWVLGGLGRYDDAAPVIDSIRRTAPFMAANATLLPVLLGGSMPAGFGASEVAALQRAPRTDPTVVRRQVVLAISLGDLVLAGRLIDSMLGLDSATVGSQARNLLLADRGRLLIERGDTTAGVEALRAGIRGGGGTNPFLTIVNRLALARALAHRPATRAEGLSMLEWMFVSDYGMVAYVELALGRALEAAGDKPGAVRHYSRLLRLWDRPSPGAEGLANEARVAVRRLTGEGQPLQ